MGEFGVGSTCSRTSLKTSMSYLLDLKGTSTLNIYILMPSLFSLHLIFTMLTPSFILLVVINMILVSFVTFHFFEACGLSIDSIDRLLGGGLRQGQLTEVTGPSSSGKTQVRR